MNDGSVDPFKYTDRLPSDVMARPKPPDPPETIEVAVAWCFDCKEVIGPNHSSDVGEEMWADHERHETQLVDEWQEDVDA